MDKLKKATRTKRNNHSNPTPKHYSKTKGEATQVTQACWTVNMQYKTDTRQVRVLCMLQRQKQTTAASDCTQSSPVEPHDTRQDERTDGRDFTSTMPIADCDCDSCGNSPPTGSGDSHATDSASA